MDPCIFVAGLTLMSLAKLLVSRRLNWWEPVLPAPFT